MKKFDPSLVVFRVISFGVLTFGAFFAGFVIAKQQIFPYHLVNSIQHQVSVAVQEIPVMLGARPIHFLQPGRYPGAGVTVNALEGDDYVALSSFFDGGTEIRLIRRDGSVVARWPAVLSELVPDLGYIGDQPATDWNVDLHGMVLNRDGSVVFNFEYTALVKLNRCGELVWRVPHQTHHSVMPSEKGGYWVPGRRIVTGDKPSAYPPIVTPYADELVLKVSEDGEIEREISVLGLFYNSGLAAMLTANGKTDVARLAEERSHEVVHLNDVEELPAAFAADFPQLRPGDLLLSIHDYNMLMAVDPVAERIRWWQIGPWLRQHDPDFQPDGRITVFDNRTDDAAGAWLGGSAVVAHDMASGSTVPVWGGTDGQRIYTAIRGSHQMRPAGGVLAVETQAGRVIETDAAGEIVWEYVHRYDEDDVVEVTGAMVLPPDYFADVDWSCNPARRS